MLEQSGMCVQTQMDGFMSHLDEGVLEPIFDVEFPPLVFVDVGLLAGILVLVGVLEELFGALGVAVPEQVLAQLQELFVDVVVHGEVAGVHDAYRK